MLRVSSLLRADAGRGVKFKQEREEGAQRWMCIQRPSARAPSRLGKKSERLRIVPLEGAVGM
jgi:hypothetical protein